MNAQTTDRGAALDDFLLAAGWAAAARQAMAGDASGRRYLRLRDDRGSAVLMDWPPPHLAARFVDLAGALRAEGLHAPAVLAADREAGFLLLEDLGPQTFADRLDAGASPEPLYALAVDLLIALRQRASAPWGGFDLPHYDADLFCGQATLYLETVFPVLTGRAATVREGEEFEAALRAALMCNAETAPILMLRDYFPGNLVWHAAGAGLARAGLIDFQDAGLGPAAYDLVSLLQDARRPVPVDLAEAMLARYGAAFPQDDPALFRRQFDALAAVRHLRVLAVFQRLCEAGRPHYGSYLPHIGGLLARSLARPGLETLRDWFDRTGISPASVPGSPPPAAGASPGPSGTD